jgi:invasion protein IalB
MKQRTILAIALGCVVALGAAAGGGFYLMRARAPVAAAIPPLPPGTRQFQSWALIGCANGQVARRCTLMHRVIARQNQQARVVLQMNVLRAGNGASVLIITLPPNVVIPAGLTLTPAGGKGAKAAVRVCRPRACSAVLVLDDALVKEMSAANSLGLQFVAATGRPVNLNLNTAGFDQGFAAWRAALPPLPAAAKTSAPEAQNGAKAAKGETAGAGAKALPSNRGEAEPARGPAARAPAK